MDVNPLAMVFVSIVAFVLIWAAFSVFSGHTRYEHSHWGWFTLGMMSGALFFVHWLGSDLSNMFLGMGVGAMVSAFSLRWWFGRKDREKGEVERSAQSRHISGRSGSDDISDRNRWTQGPPSSAR